MPQTPSRKSHKRPPRRAWVFTSATLAVKNDFRHFTEALGLEDAACASWASPYDYPSQAMLYVPAGLPLPNDPTHTDAVVDAALPLIRANRGRAFVLCTSLRAVARAALAPLRRAVPAAVHGARGERRVRRGGGEPAGLGLGLGFGLGLGLGLTLSLT